MSPAYHRYLELCLKPGTDFARTPEEFEARAARALAALLDDAPPAPFDPQQRAVRTLQDVAWRISHADALAPHAETDAALRALADAITTARTADDPDQVVADTLSEAMARLEVSPTPRLFVSAPGPTAAFALGYSPVTDPSREPAVVRDMRALALVRRAYALHPALGAAIEGMMPVARRVLAEPVRSAGIIEQVIAVGEDSARANEVPWLGYAYLGWMQVAAGAWQSSDPAAASQRWHYRLARRNVPDDPAVFSEYEVAWNPYLKRYPLPFDSKWNDELRRTRPGEAKTFKGKNTTSVWYCYIGPGRERPVYLPLVARLNALIFHMKSPRRLDELVRNPDFGLDFIRDAVTDEAVLLFHKPRFDRPERALDVYEVAMEMAAGLDSSLEPFGPWDEEDQAEAYQRFCETSGHYRESSAALCELVGIPADGFIGELGFGTGETTRQILSRLGPEGRYFGVDAAPRMLNHMLETTRDDRARFQAGGARALAWTAAYEGGFTRIVANACIWLVPNLSEALDNLLRAAAPAGRLALSIPAEYLGYVDHLQSEPSIAVATALTDVRADLAIDPPGPDAQTASPDMALGDRQRFADALRLAGWDNVEFTLWERPWTVGEYIDWLAMPVVAEGLCHTKDKGRAAELILGLRQRVDPALPLTAAWYFITAQRP
jgi:SAM-dependent methyltransferase